MTLLFENYIKTNKEAFKDEVVRYSNMLGINPNWLMLLMWIESAHTFSASIQNKDTLATGLIQFMPKTARILDTSTDSLKNMTNVQQLYYVYKYLKPYASKFNTYVDVYFAIFFPIAIGRPDTFILQSSDLSASTVVRYNSGYDLNKDGKITVGEIKQKLLTFVPAVWAENLKKKSL